MNNLHTVVLIQVFLSNTNNFQKDWFGQLQVRVDLGLMATKEYSTLYRAESSLPNAV